MVYLIIFIIFLAVFAFSYFVLIQLNYKKLQIENRINQIKDNSVLDETEGRTFLERAILPIYTHFADFFYKATPSKKLEALGKKLERVGYSKKISLEKWIFNKAMTIIIVFLSSYMLFNLIVKNSLKSLAMAFLLSLLTSVLFDFNLSRKVDRRKKSILRDLPYILDLITVSVEAGLSFDGAIARVIENIKGDLSDEFAKTLKEIRMGIQRKVALKNMSERCDIREISMLITSLIQADELGVSLGKVLRIESSNLREQRKQIAREKALKAPVKMLFPLIFFIFPTVFTIILGPAVIKIYNFFAK
ncbi:MAG: type II secretion system F family protein [Caloramator sp.]|nr:type II secretion system F family protein [Caloramator sp.]